jgi:hypothetical protein
MKMKTLAIMRMSAGRVRHGRFRSVTYAIGFVLCALVGSASAAEIEGVRFPEVRASGDVRLVLNNVALLRYRVFFRGYVAGLYLGADVGPEALFDDVPKRLEISYFWGIPAYKFAEATINGISANRSAESVREMQPAIEQFNDLYQDIEPGDRYALTYIPNVGTELARNGVSLGTVAGAEFASALFSIWFGTVPFDESLKRRLLTPAVT